jgi:hypothetical protein
MKISSFDDNIQYEDIESLQIVIKSIPFENTFVPSFLMMSPDDSYEMTIDELNSLMDGVEIARQRLDEIIEYILKRKIFDKLGNDKYEYKNQGLNAKDLENLEDESSEIETEDDEESDD